MSGEQQTQDSQALFAADCGEHVGEARSMVGSACFHSSMVVELWNQVKCFTECGASFSLRRMFRVAPVPGRGQ
jgi:hypothetical protein